MIASGLRSRSKILAAVYGAEEVVCLDNDGRWVWFADEARLAATVCRQLVADGILLVAGDLRSGCGGSFGAVYAVLVQEVDNGTR